MQQNLFFSSMTLMIAQISEVYMEAESGNFMEIMVLEGKTVVQVTEFPSREQEYNHGTSLVFP